MDLNNLTLGQIKELQSIFTGNKIENSMLKSYIGKYVICRTRNEGINAGVVVNIDETGVILKDCRRIWYHEPKDKKLSWYEGVSISGVSDNSKLSAPVEKVIIEDYSLTLVTDEAEKSIRGIKNHAQ